MASFSQQTSQYTQYTFNKYGYNPAAAGTSINGGIEIITGVRKQWMGFERSPLSTFISANYTIKPERSYKRWHNIGVYLSQERAGIFKNENMYLSYTIHLRMTNKWNIALGVFAGVRQFGLTRGVISLADPVYTATSSTPFYAYPDFIPGIRLHSKKVFFDISAQQIVLNKQVQGNKRIGTQSVLTPQIYVSFGKKYFLNEKYIVIPSVNIRSSLTHLPSAEFNLMVYYAKTIGIGTTIRNKDFISGIFQIRFLKNLTAGFAYDYSINKIGASAANSLEFMVGMTPFFSSMGSERGKHNDTACPKFDF